MHHDRCALHGWWPGVLGWFCGGVPWRVVAGPHTRGRAGRLAAQPVASRPLRERLTFAGFADLYYAFNDNHRGWRQLHPGTGTTAKRANEFAVNLVEFEVSATPEPVGFKIAVGSGMRPMWSTLRKSPRRDRSDTWENLIQASVMYATHVGGTDLRGGIYPSHIGFEGFLSKDNWNYTRSWMGEFSPYYQTGSRSAIRSAITGPGSFMW